MDAQEFTERPNRLYGIGEVGEPLGGLGRSAIYALIQQGELETVRIGRRVMVTQREVERFVERVARGELADFRVTEHRYPFAEGTTEAAS
jgi:excisionase family DNA binding protein